MAHNHNHLTHLGRVYDINGAQRERVRPLAELPTGKHCRLVVVDGYKYEYTLKDCRRTDAGYVGRTGKPLARGVTPVAWKQA